MTTEASGDFIWFEDVVRVYDFDEELALSKGVEANGPDDALMAAIPGALRVEAASTSDDRSGVDRWVICDGGRRVGVDIKRRKEDWAAKTYPQDDLALESWSVVGRKEGWTLDPAKRCEYILWWWADTGRWCLVPFVMLRAVFSEHLDEWRSEYDSAAQETHRSGSHPWRSECIFVPRLVVWRAIYDRFGGAVTAA